MTAEQFKKEVYKVVCGDGANDENFNDKEVIDRIRMYSDFREKIYETVLERKRLNNYLEEEEGHDPDSKWTRWALDNIS